MRNHIYWLGWLIIIWSVVDFVMNFVLGAQDIADSDMTIETCLLAQLGQLFFRREDLFLAIDTFLSFSIICYVLWSGWIKDFTQIELYAWYAATTVNLISLSIVNIMVEISKRPTHS